MNIIISTTAGSAIRIKTLSFHSRLTKELRDLSVLAGTCIFFLLILLRLPVIMACRSVHNLFKTKIIIGIVGAAYMDSRGAKVFRNDFGRRTPGNARHFDLDAEVLISQTGSPPTDDLSCSPLGLLQVFNPLKIGMFTGESPFPWAGTHPN